MGPLSGVRVLEFCGIGPGPFCGMLLADMGADVLLVERAGASELGLPRERRQDLLHRNKRSIVLDLKSEAGLRVARDLVSKADAVLEGFRPGVMEKLGLGPDACLRLNPRLVYGRMTGWGQDGPLRLAAGHDLNYIGLVGALDAIGRKDAPPTPPLNLLGDNGGGALYLALGLVAGLYEAQRSGAGQVVDAAIVDGAASLMTMIYAFRQTGLWDRPRGENIIDSGAPDYDVYETKDGRYVAVAPLEAKFYDAMLDRLGLSGEAIPDRRDPDAWPALRERLRKEFRRRTRDEWAVIMADADACVTPVLSMDEVARHPHHLARNAFVDFEGLVQPAPAPRFSRTPSALRRGPPEKGEGAGEALRAWGVEAPGP